MIFSRVHLRRLVPVVVVAGLVLSGLLAWQAERAAAETDRLRFDRLSERLEHEITRRMRQFEYGLRGAHSLWPASEEVKRGEFAALVHDHVLADEFPGALGIGFIRRVARAETDAFLARTRADGAPDFTIRSSGDAADLYVIEYIEPLAQNLAAQGYDIGQEPRRRAAAEEAMLTGRAVLTEPIKLVQAEHEGPGFLIYYPVYADPHTPATEAERRERLVGWVYMPILASRILTDIVPLNGGEVDFDIFEAGRSNVDGLIYDADGRLPPHDPRDVAAHRGGDDFHTHKLMPVSGRTWDLTTRRGPRFASASRVGVWAALLGGPLLTATLAGLFQVLGRTARHAEELAAAKTADLAAAVRHSEMLALVATRTTNAVMFTDARRRITWINEGFTRLTGYTIDEALGRTPGELVQCPQTDPAAISAMRAALARGESYRGELLNRAKSGRLYWIDIDIVPLRDAANAVTGFMAVELDVTERKEAAARLAEQAERTELALAAGEFGTWDWHIPSGKTIFDQRWAEMLGERLEDVSPHVDEWIRRCHPEDMPRAQAELHRHFEGEAAIYRCLHRVRHRDGGWRWIMDTGKVVSRDTSGHPVRMVGTHQDVTAQHLARLELERGAAALHHTGRLARVGSWELEVATRRLTWSDQMRAIHEVPPDHAPTLASAIAFFPGEACATITRLLHEAIDEGGSFDVELPFVSALGNELWVRVLGEAHRPAGRTLVVRGALQDITESHRQREALARAKETAEAATRAKADFLANMSHEIRTPMNAVIGMTELLQYSELTPEQREFVGTIRTSGETLLALINDILDFSKIESGQLELEHIPVSPRECVDDAVDLTARGAAAKSLELVVWIEPDVPAAILGDQLRLRQILVNLLTNAIKFTSRGEVLVTVSLQPPEKPGDHGPALPPLPRVRFSVRDTGIGIPADRLDRLFKTFSQVDASTTRKYGGTGLGLAICSRLVALMRGRIWVESTPGQGSTFHFEVPAEAVASSAPRAEPLADVTTLRGRRLLLVEDNPTNRRILTLQAEGWGLQVAAATNAAEALVWLDRGDVFDAAIIDVQMPGMDGRTLAAEVRRRRDARALPLLVLTSLGQGAREFAGLEVARVLAKPAKSQVLLAALRRVLQPASAGASAAPSPSAGAPAASASVVVAAPAARHASPLARPASDAPPLRILLVEDLPSNQAVALALLERLGHRADVAEHGAEALAAVERASYDVVFLDVQMPEMDGLTCARRLCARHPATERPWIIAMTGNALEGDRAACLAAGMDDYLSKPVTGQLIAAALARAAEGLARRRPAAPAA